MRYWYLYEGQISGPLEPGELKIQSWFSPSIAVCPENHGKGENQNWKMASDYADFALGGKDNGTPPTTAPGMPIPATQPDFSRLAELETLLGDFMQAQASNLEHVRSEIKRILEDLKGDSRATSASAQNAPAPAPAPIFQPPPAPIYTTPQSEPVTETLEQEETYEEASEETEPQPLVIPQAVDDAPIKVLVADDDEVLRYVYSLILSEYNCAMTQVTNGNDAFEQAKKIKPDLIILDHNMPGMTGFDTIRALRDHPTLRKTPIILITGREFDKDFKEWVKMEVQEFLAKPFNAEDVIKAIQKALKRPLTPVAKT